jgi:hypothetical protein
MTTSLIKPALLVLVPFLNAIGLCLKGKKHVASDRVFSYPLAKVKSKFIPFILLLEIAMAIATIYGFIVSSDQGWRMALDAVFVTGLLQGAVVLSF